MTVRSTYHPFSGLLKPWLNGKWSPIPDSFLGGSGPGLKYFDLDGIPFPGLPKLLLSASATHLVDLTLRNIPHFEYPIPPEAMVATLSVLSSLRSLFLHSQSQFHRPCPDRKNRSLLPPKSFIMPALGLTEYLEDLVTSIDAPQLGNRDMDITFLNPTNFDCPQLARSIDCTTALRPCGEAQVRFELQASSFKPGPTRRL